MVDFDSYVPAGPTTAPTDPLQLFESLDRRASHTALRPVQTEALRLLDARRGDRDLVLKVSTGAGKTSVALLYAYSHMVENREPAVYLCPTTQLVDQVLFEAQNLGIPAVNYPAKQSLPGPEALSGRAVIVCTYDKLFNARTTFNRNDVMITPCALVLDDAHAGIEEVRGSFTLSAAKGDVSPGYDVYGELIKILGPGCKEHHPGIWAGIERGAADALLEVPFWLWSAKLDDVRNVLEGVADGQPNVFIWGNLRDGLRWCRCIISGTGLEIFFDTIPTHVCRPYREAKHRLFMSATLSDDSALVRDLGCSADAAARPLVPPSDAGLGERMILAPSLIDPALDRAWVMQWCQSLSSRFRVAVLASSEVQAREWEKLGAKVEIGDGVRSTIDGLRSGSLSFVAFAQRYDGVDLPDDACRVLVLDGVPRGQGLGEDHDRNVPGRPGGAFRRWAYRIEQGMGRAVRSHADYAVIVVAGPDLANFLAKGDVRRLLGLGTRLQLDLGEELVRKARVSGQAPDVAVRDMANKCLGRDAGWKRFYDERVKKKTPAPSSATDGNQIEMASAENEALRAALGRDTRRAAEVLTQALNKVKPSEEQVGWVLQRKANYTHEHDAASALAIQKSAHQKNNQMSPPPDGVVVRPPASTGNDAAVLILQWYGSFANGNGAIASLMEMKAALAFTSKVDAFEQGLADIAATFGATGTRPEKAYRRGPDDLWVWPGQAWVIEAKHERGQLPKADGEQALSAMKWFKENYPERYDTAVPVIIARPTRANHDAYFPDGTRVVKEEGMQQLLANVSKFVAELAQKPVAAWSPGQVNSLLQTHHLQASQFSGAYSVPLSR